MTGRACAVAFVAGAAWVQTRAALPSATVLIAWGISGGAVLAALAWCCRKHAVQIVLPLMTLWLGITLAVWHADHRLADALELTDELRVARVDIQVAGLPQGDASGWRFEARVLRAAPARIPERIEVSWYAPGRFSPYGKPSEAKTDAPALPEIKPGQIWQAALVMRRPHGTLNPQGFDYEGWMFQRGIRARGTVRGDPVLLADQPWAGAGVAIARLRHLLRERLRGALGQSRYGAVLIALALGDQAGVAAGDWQTFNRTGITHLVSISGLHVTMVAAMLGWVASALWRRWRWRGLALAEKVPAQTVGITAAMLAALAYCLLAGWGVPARRTFFMLVVAAGTLIFRLPGSPSRILAAAACVVTALDPQATVAPGFWLSFGAVAVLMFMAAGMPHEPHRAQPRGQQWRGVWHKAVSSLTLAARVQLGISLALTAPLAFFFLQVPIGTPLANALAIPVVSFAVTPLALLATFFVGVFDGIPGGAWLAAHTAQAGHAIFAALMQPISWLADAPWSLWYVAAASWPWLVLALAGTVMALLPRGWPLRHAGWLLLVPLLAARAPPLEPGAWRWLALDVGQGMAVVVQTASSTLLYDTGVRYSPTSDQGVRVVVPTLRGLGVRKLDTLVLSHADLDHVGGVRSLLQALPVAQAFSSFDLDRWLQTETRLLGSESGPEPPRPAAMQRCVAGMAWQVDDVTFEFLHPESARTGQGANADSCVLRVQGRYHTALMAGDISAAEEHMLAEKYLLQTDVILMPHHGARGSSSPAWVEATGARHAVAQVGHHNRYGHPSPAVIDRWQQSGAKVWRSDQHGAVTAVSSADGLTVSARRQTHRRYWHGQ